MGVGVGAHRDRKWSTTVIFVVRPRRDCLKCQRQEIHPMDLNDQHFDVVGSDQGLSTWGSTNDDAIILPQVTDDDSRNGDNNNIRGSQQARRQQSRYGRDWTLGVAVLVMECGISRVALARGMWW